MGHEIECWQDSNNKQTTLFITIPEPAKEPVAPKLVFHRYGDEYVLAEVWTADAGHVVRPSKYEQKLAKSQKAKIVALLLPAAK
jgi:hypothetical protein